MAGEALATVVAAKALDGLTLRMAAIAQNIANANSQQFRPLEVRFEEALRIAALREGITMNTDNPPLNHDMDLIIGKCEELLARQTQAEPGIAPEEVSATSFLLGTRRH
jgi:flagellar basal body rod protein FlgG